MSDNVHFGLHRRVLGVCWRCERQAGYDVASSCQILVYGLGRNFQI